jgi:hypothetical protein
VGPFAAVPSAAADAALGVTPVNTRPAARASPAASAVAEPPARNPVDVAAPAILRLIMASPLPVVDGLWLTGWV